MYFQRRPRNRVILVQGPGIREQLIPWRADLTQAKVKIQLRLSRASIATPAPKKNKKKGHFPLSRYQPSRSDPTARTRMPCHRLRRPNRSKISDTERAPPCAVWHSLERVRALAACPEPFSAVDPLRCRGCGTRWFGGLPRTPGTGHRSCMGLRSGIQTNAATTNTRQPSANLTPSHGAGNLGLRSKGWLSPIAVFFLSLR